MNCCFNNDHFLGFLSSLIPFLTFYKSTTSILYQIEFVVNCFCFFMKSKVSRSNCISCSLQQFQKRNNAGNYLRLTNFQKGMFHFKNKIASKSLKMHIQSIHHLWCMTLSKDRSKRLRTTRHIQERIRLQKKKKRAGLN